MQVLLDGNIKMHMNSSGTVAMLPSIFQNVVSYRMI